MAIQTDLQPSKFPVLYSSNNPHVWKLITLITKCGEILKKKNWTLLTFPMQRMGCNKLKNDSIDVIMCEQKFSRLFSIKSVY